MSPIRGLLTPLGITVVIAAAALTMGRDAALSQDVPGWETRGAGLAFLPGLSSDAGDPPASCPSTPDIWVTDKGIFTRVDGETTFTSHKQAAALFQFTNPCSEPIAPPPLEADLTADGVEYSVIMSAIPSIVAPGGIGFYVVMLPQDGPAATVDFEDISVPYSFDDSAEVARLLTVDRNGNDATMPEFDPTHITPWYTFGLEVEQQGEPPVWPLRLWVYGTCADGSLGLGQFNPDVFGLNADGGTTVPGHVSFAGCVPPVVSILGPEIDRLFVETGAGGTPNSLLLDNLTLEQTSDGFFRLMGTVANTNTIAGDPGLFNFSLNRAAGGDPFAFSIPGNEPVFPGNPFVFSINNIPGDANDFDSIVGSISGTNPVPDAVAPAWVLPPTVVDGPAGVGFSYFVQPNYDAFVDEGLDEGAIFARMHVRYADGQLDLFDGTSMALGPGGEFFTVALADNPDVYDRLHDLLQNRAFNIPVATSFNR